MAYDLRPDLIVSDRFRLKRMIGRGGMGSVWAAFDTALNIDVAIKFIETALDEAALTRFGDEARMVARIKSTHVIQVLDFGIRAGMPPYIAMELLDGESLETRLERTGKLSLADTMVLVRQVVRGLTKAHAQGVVHRDIKPDNLFIVRDDDGDVVKILDFGVAKAAGPCDVKRTGTGVLIGTPLYMSPEQARGRAIDWQSDMFSLAVVTYLCMTGQPPFAAETLGDLIIAISTEPHVPVTHKDPSLPVALDAWFTRALAKDPRGRFASTKEFIDALDAACASSPHASQRPSFSVRSAESTGDFGIHVPALRALPADLSSGSNPSGAAPVSIAHAATIQTGPGIQLESLSGRSRRSRTVPLLIAATLALSLAGGGVAMLARKTAPSASGEPQEPPAAAQPQATALEPAEPAAAPSNAPSTIVVPTSLPTVTAPVTPTAEPPAPARRAPAVAHPPAQNAPPPAKPATKPKPAHDDFAL